MAAMIMVLGYWLDAGDGEVVVVVVMVYVSGNMLLFLFS